ncbi:MAG: fatty acid desaturase [Rhizobiaceae bacterium]|nr:fatty acid desaturase [Rhizobiaceae bacterium]
MILKNNLEWRTVALIIFCYAMWLLLVFGLSRYSIVIACLALIPVITLHSSLQHECLHGHPFRWSFLNDALASVPIGLFIPYLRFKDSHLKHHQNAQICDPFDDPESWYLEQAFWHRLPRVLKFLFDVNNTLAGRLLLGPGFVLVRTAITDGRAMLQGDRMVLRAWAIHLSLLVPLVVIIAQWSPMGLATYLLASYGGLSLLMVRTYLEHQAEENARGRSVIIEDKSLLSLLFLNNNLHAVHHAYPAVAWHQLPSLYQRNRDRFLAMNKGYYYRNYAEILRQFAFRRKERVPFPESLVADQSPKT